MKIRIANQSKHPLPSYETIASAGMDLRAEWIEVEELAATERGPGGFAHTGTN